jgi:hypothetical protein
MSDERRSGASPGERAIDAAWRRASADEPSPRADAAILAAARAAAHGTAQSGHAAPPARRRWHRWRAMAAAAAVAAVAFLLVPRTEREERLIYAPRQGAPTESTRPATGAAPADVAAAGREAASSEMPAPPAAAPAGKMQQVAPQATTPSAAAASVPAEAGARAEAAAPAPAAAPSRAVTAAAADASTGTGGRQEWIDRIASLHAAGDMAAAATALQEFRREYPDADAQLPPALRAWAAAVPQPP